MSFVRSFIILENIQNLSFITDNLFTGKLIHLEPF